VQKKKVNFSQEVELNFKSNINNIPISNLDHDKDKEQDDSYRGNIAKLKQRIEPVASQGNH